MSRSRSSRRAAARKRAKTPLPSVLRGAIDEFNAWSDKHLAAQDESNKVIGPLYHYTDAAGLEGIIKNQQIWFTAYAHLNDPSELTYGISAALRLLKEIGERADPRIRLFCEMIADLFTHENLQSSFGFYIASFSRARDDLGQWRAYADNGRGFALGLDHKLFQVEDKPHRKPHENVFVAPVVYGDSAARERHLPAIEKALEVVAAAIDSGSEAMRDKTIGIPFLDQMAKALIASQLIVNCLTIKHAAYEHEREVRLIIPGGIKTLRPYVSTRSRGAEIVPFIKSDMPIQAKGSIAEIVVGPAAAANAKNAVKALLRPFLDESEMVIGESGIPYRPR